MVPRQKKSNFSLYSLYYAQACNEFARLISESLCPRNTALFKEMLQRWRATDNTVFNLTCPSFQPQISRSRDFFFHPELYFAVNYTFHFIVKTLHILWPVVISAIKKTSNTTFIIRQILTFIIFYCE